MLPTIFLLLIFIFCSFVVLTAGHFMLRLTLLLVLMVSVLFSIVITSPAEERAGTFVCLFCTRYFPFLFSLLFVVGSGLRRVSKALRRLFITYFKYLVRNA